MPTNGPTKGPTKNQSQVRPGDAGVIDMRASAAQPLDPSTVTRIDAHCHSYASSKPVNKAVGLFNCPECFSEPERVYDQAKSRGMDLVTITDHDTVAGAMELVERGYQDFIVGQEVSVHFPEDHCLLHVLLYDLTPELDQEIDDNDLRKDVYQFAAWVRERNLPHSLAHPLYIQNGRLTRWHIERASLLFKVFENLNGAHAAQMSDAIARFCSRLTPGQVHKLVAEHELEPLWPRVWEKGRTGGSDDHGLLNIGRTWTALANAVVHPAEPNRKVDAKTFFQHVMRCDTEVSGTGGHSALLAHQLATVGANYFARTLHDQQTPSTRYMSAKLLRFAGVHAPAPSKARVAAHQVTRRMWLPKKRKRRSSPLVKALRRELKPVLEKYPDIAQRLDPQTWNAGSALSEHERMADFTQDLMGALSRSMAGGARKSLRRRDPTGIVEHLMSYGLLHVAQLPYLFSLFHQNKERNFLDRFEHETSEPGSGVSVLERPMRISLFTDTIADVNGVCRFIQNVAEKAHDTGRDLQVITSTRLDMPVDLPNIYNFEPVFSTAIPKYENLDLNLPPIMKILRHLDEHQPDVIHISTPGPVGCVGFLAAKMLRVPVLGVYHTDFPAYIDRLFDDHGLTQVCQKFMKGFYSPFSHIFTRSDDYRASLTRLGLSEDKVLHLMPGFDADVFHVRHRDERVWDGLGVSSQRVKVLYVGRVSVEKNLPFLTRVWKRVQAELRKRNEPAAELVVVGDGPYRQQMAEELRGEHASFLGFRHGHELSTIYASSDMFAFPSTTDTLGQVVMESQGSGLPVFVTDMGGPKEVVEDGKTGFVLPCEGVSGEDRWVKHLVELAVDQNKRRTMGQAAHESMQQYSLLHSFEDFWRVHTEAWHDHLSTLGIRRVVKRTDHDHALAPAGG